MDMHLVDADYPAPNPATMHGTTLADVSVDHLILLAARQSGQHARQRPAPAEAVVNSDNFI